MVPHTCTEDVARFAPGDAAPLVLASMVCGYCLSEPGLVDLGGKPGSRVAYVRCAGCAATTVVRLSDEQAYRLWTQPRGRTFVHFPAERW